MTNVTVDLSTARNIDGSIEFYCALSGTRQVGFFKSHHPDHMLALEAIAEHGRAPRVMTLGGAVPPRLEVTEGRVRELLAEGGTWGLYGRVSRG